MRKKYKMPHKRRRLKRTNYKLRLGLLKSSKSRLVIRKSNKHIMGQIVKYEKNGDKTIISAHSIMLKKLGWEKNCSNVPAAYLTGFFLGKKAKEKNINEAVLDLGLQNNTKGNRIYAFLKGALDAGLKINHSKDVIPKEERISGEHINKDIVKEFEALKNKIIK